LFWALGNEFSEILFDKLEFSAFLSLFLRFFFALPSLLSRNDTAGFRDAGAKRTYVFAASIAGFRGGAEANFVQR